MRKFHTLILVAILTFAYLARLYHVSTPPDYYFDEVYHAFTAKYYAANDPAAYEWWHTAPDGVAFEWLHPPLAKLAQGLSINILGDNSFAWRLPSVIFGTLTILSVYFLTKQLFGNKNLGLLAAFLASLDGLLLTQSRIAMNDIFVVFFMLLTLGWFWRYYQTRTSKYLVLTGVMAGLAMSSKWSGLFVLGICYTWLLLDFCYQRRGNLNLHRLKFTSLLRTATLVLWLLILPGVSAGLLFKYFLELTSQQGNALVLITLILLLSCWFILGCLLFRLRQVLKYSFCLLLLPSLIYVLSFGQFWLQDRPNNWRTFIDLHHQIWWYQTHLDATHPWQSRPLEWVLNKKPVWYYVNYQDNGHASHIFALSNPTIALLGLASITITTGFGIYQLAWAKNRRRRRQTLPVLLYLSLAYFLTWTPWLLSPRIMFFYHYAPAIPLLAIALSWILYRLWTIPRLLTKAVTATIVVLTVGLFIYFYPFWTGGSLTTDQVNHRYWLPSWRP